MSQSGIETGILSKLYEAYFLPEGKLDSNYLRNQLGADEKTFRKEVDKLIYNGLIRDFKTDDYLKIMHLGIEEVENKHLGPGDLLKKNKRARAMILKALSDVFEEEGAGFLFTTKT